MTNQWKPSDGFRERSESTHSLQTVVPIAQPPTSENHEPCALFVPFQENERVPLDPDFPSKGIRPTTPQGAHLEYLLPSYEGPWVLLEHGDEPTLDTMSNDDEVVFRGNSRNREHNIRPPQTLERNAPPTHRIHSSSPRQADSRADYTPNGKLGLNGGVSPGRSAGGEGQPSRGQFNPFKSAPPAAREELVNLQKQIVQKAHMNRFKNINAESTNPEALAKVREGPGTDPNSEDYKELRRRGSIPGTGASASDHTFPGVYNGFKRWAEKNRPPLKQIVEERFNLQRSIYAKTPVVYPSFENGQLVLVSEPTTDSALILNSSNKDEVGLRMGVANLQPDNPDQVAENNWGDAFYADWEYRPRACSNFEAFRDWFRRWLDTTMSLCCRVDIHHSAFFDGTAHPDGERSLIIPELDNVPSSLDCADEQSRRHHHETVEGYCYNWALKLKKEEEEEHGRRIRARNAYIEGINTMPVVNTTQVQSPKANLYLRPVELHDIPELLHLFNWYIHNTTLTVDHVPLEAGEVRERIESSRRVGMPFIVAAERRSAQSRGSSLQKILGYALARDHIGDRTAGRFTAELELFVRPEYKNLGIAKCLMDKLLEVCDPTYNPLGGYSFDANWEERPWYRPGGRRRLVRLIFIITYPHIDRAEHQWVQKWLEKGYDFEKQGVLKGTRIKSERLMDAHYFVRKVGHADDDTLRN